MIFKISLAFGLAVMAIACFTGHVSGGNLNPAVSIGLLAGGQLSLIKCLLYIIVQNLGAVIGKMFSWYFYSFINITLAGTILFYSIKGDNSLGVNDVVNERTTPFGGLVLEMLMTMLLVLVVYATGEIIRYNQLIFMDLLQLLTRTTRVLPCCPLYS